MSRTFIRGLALATALVAGVAYAQSNPTVGGAPMLVERNIVENAVNSPIHTTLVAAVKAGGLVETLSGPGPFTVFAPVNDAFAALPAGTVDTLLMPENKDQLVNVLTYHVVPGDLSGGELLRDVQANGGKLMLETVSGDMITIVESGPGLAVMDESGNTAVITIADVDQSNGVIHVIDGVLLPS
jgi:uncharacterized surface protein with fasciclin (FAS1) repeats